MSDTTLSPKNRGGDFSVLCVFIHLINYTAYLCFAEILDLRTDRITRFGNTFVVNFLPILKMVYPVAILENGALLHRLVYLRKSTGDIDQGPGDSWFGFC